MKIKTEVLKELLNKVSKGSSNNKFLPITSLLKIELNSNTLELETYDGRNYLKVTSSSIEGDDMYAVVDTDTITKLVEKTTSEYTEITLEENVLRVKGNGVYTIDVPMEEGEKIRFPESKFDMSTAKTTRVLTNVLKTSLNVNKPSLSQTFDLIALTGYHLDSECILTTNSFVATFNEEKILDSPVLITPTFVNLLNIISSEYTTLYYDAENIAAVGENITVIGKTLEGIETYPVDTIKGLLTTEFSSMCKIPRQSLIDILDRLSIFVKDYDNNAVDLTFTSDGLVLSTKKTTGTEKILYSSVNNFKDFKCSLDVTMLKDQLDVLSNEVIEMWFGNDDSIKLVDGKVSQIIATVIENNA